MRGGNIDIYTPQDENIYMVRKVHKIIVWKRSSPHILDQ